MACAEYNGGLLHRLCFGASAGSKVEPQIGLQWSLEPGATDMIVNLKTSEKPVIACFTPGTKIATVKGEVPVERLVAGDRVVTRDNGVRVVRWTGQKKLDWRTLASNQHLKPILLRQGCLGRDLPERDLMVSPNHRVLVSNDRTALQFDEPEVLVAAKHLICGLPVRSIDSIGTTYIHFLFDQHQVVLSDGIWTESFQPTDTSLKGFGNSQRAEIFEIFPSLQSAEGRAAFGAARKTLTKEEASQLID